MAHYLDTPASSFKSVPAGAHRRHRLPTSDTPRAAAWLPEAFGLLLPACGPLEGRRVLEIGFAGGRLSRIMDILGATVDAMESKTTEIPRLREEQPGVYWFAADVMTWQPPIGNPPYDLILWHSRDAAHLPSEGLSRMVEVLAPKGRLVVQQIATDPQGVPVPLASNWRAELAPIPLRWRANPIYLNGPGRTRRFRLGAALPLSADTHAAETLVGWLATGQRSGD